MEALAVAISVNAGPALVYSACVRSFPLTPCPLVFLSSSAGPRFSSGRAALFASGFQATLVAEFGSAFSRMTAKMLKTHSPSSTHPEPSAGYGSVAIEIRLRYSCAREVAWKARSSVSRAPVSGRLAHKDSHETPRFSPDGGRRCSQLLFRMRGPKDNGGAACRAAKRGCGRLST